MQIIWHGQFCFQITSTKGKNNYINIVIDPFDETDGLRIPKLTADILLISHNHHSLNNIKTVLGNPFIIDGPGEYEIKEVFVRGIDSYYDSSFEKEKVINTIYVFETEGVRICHLGNLGQKELTSEQIEQIGGIDILMLPISNVYAFSAKEAAEIISQIEPKIIIPMHYQIPKLKLNLDSLDKFLKIVGIKAIEPQNKLIIKKKDIFEQDPKIIILNP